MDGSFGCALGIGQGEQADEIGGALVGMEDEPNGVHCMRLRAGSCMHMQSSVQLMLYPSAASSYVPFLDSMHCHTRHIDQTAWGDSGTQLQSSTMQVQNNAA